MHTLHHGSVLLFVLVASCMATYIQEIKDDVSGDGYEPEMTVAEEDPFAIPPGTLDIEGNVFDRRRIKQTLVVDNGDHWGTWGDPSLCPEGSYAAGYDMKIEPEQGSGDDTSLNGIKIVCKDKYGHIRREASSSVGHWGNWVGRTFCRANRSTTDYMTAFSLQVERPQGWRKDDTAGNYVKFLCRGLNKQASNEYDLVKPPGHGYWGRWGDWSASCPTGSAICGIKTRVEYNHIWHIFKDDTALNDAVFYCC